MKPAIFLTVLACCFSISSAANPTRPMIIKIRTEAKEVLATLEPTAAARDFASSFPLTVTLKDYNATEKVSDLPKKLSTSGAPAGYDPAVGDIAYYAPWGNLAIFYRDFPYSTGLVKLGRIQAGLEELIRGDAPKKVTFELVKDE